MGATDPESTPLVYEISQVIPSSVSRFLYINPTNGTLTLAQPVDFEKDTNDGDLVITVRVYDNNGDPTTSQSNSSTITVNVVTIIVNYISSHTI